MNRFSLANVPYTFIPVFLPYQINYILHNNIIFWNLQYEMQ